MNHQKKYFMSIFNIFRDKEGGLRVPPPQSKKVQTGAWSLRIKDRFKNGLKIKGQFDNSIYDLNGLNNL